MGNNRSSLSDKKRSTNSSFIFHCDNNNEHNKTLMMEISKKINEKNYVFMAMEPEINGLLSHPRDASIKNLLLELSAHIIDLEQLKHIDMPEAERVRYQKVLNNYEYVLALLNSIKQQNPKLDDNNKPKPPSPERKSDINHQTNPDLVNDLGNFPTLDNSSKVRKLEECLQSVENELRMLKDKAEKATDDITDYYQIDKEAFYLQVKLNQLDCPHHHHQGTLFSDRIFQLLKELQEFRINLDEKSGKLEEKQQLLKEINTLEMELDSAVSGKDYKNLKTRALSLIEIFEKIPSSHDKDRNLSRLDDILKIIQSHNKETYYSRSESPIYVNSNSLEQEVLKSIESIDKVLQEHQENDKFISAANNDNEEIYENLNEIRQNLTKNVPSNNRETFYMNADIVKQNSFSSCKNRSEFQNKRPLPLPRNYTDKIIRDLSKNWERLDEILKKDLFTDKEKTEVEEIRRQAEIARTLFERRITQILEKSAQEIVEL